MSQCPIVPQLLQEDKTRVTRVVRVSTSTGRYYHPPTLSYGAVKWEIRVDKDILVDAWRTWTRQEPKRQKNVVQRKEKEKGKTRKKINFSQETLSPRWVSKVLKSINLKLFTLAQCQRPKLIPLAPVRSLIARSDLHNPTVPRRNGGGARLRLGPHGDGRLKYLARVR